MACRLMIPMINHARPLTSLAGFTSWKSSKRTRHMALKTKAKASHGFLMISIICLHITAPKWHLGSKWVPTNHPFLGLLIFKGGQIVQNCRPRSSWWCPKQSCRGSSQVLFPYLQKRMMILQLAHGVVDIIDPGWKDKGPEIFENTGWNINWEVPSWNGMGAMLLSGSVGFEEYYFPIHPTHPTRCRGPHNGHSRHENYQAL